MTSTPVTCNILDTAAALGTFKTFAAAVEKAGLNDTLNGPGPFTVFAPTDAAFALLPSGCLEALFMPENKAELVSMLNYHLMKGRKSSYDVSKWLNAKTVHGQFAPISIASGRMCIDGANISAADIDSSNGVIHGIDKVNMPALANGRATALR
jgi:uncharacterized surface protein with fasciclin (FAS1) repeats